MASESSDREPVFICFEGKVIPEHSSQSSMWYTTLSSLVTDQPGYISQTPFASPTTGKQVLYVKFESDADLHRWRNHPTHLSAQAQGRAKIFEDYRIRIGHEVRDHSSIPRTAGKYLLLWQFPTTSSDPAPTMDVDHEPTDAATYIGASSTLKAFGWSDRATAIAARNAVPRVDGDDLRLIAVDRDYSRFQREEAPADTDRC